MCQLSSQNIPDSAAGMQGCCTVYFGAVQCSAVQCRPNQYSTVHRMQPAHHMVCCTAQHATMLHSVLRCGAILCSTVQYTTRKSNRTVPHAIILQCIALHCCTQQYPPHLHHIFHFTQMAHARQCSTVPCCILLYHTLPYSYRTPQETLAVPYTVVLAVHCNAAVHSPHPPPPRGSTLQCGGTQCPPSPPPPAPPSRLPLHTGGSLLLVQPAGGPPAAASPAATHGSTTQQGCGTCTCIQSSTLGGWVSV